LFCGCSTSVGGSCETGCEDPNTNGQIKDCSICPLYVSRNVITLANSTNKSHGYFNPSYGKTKEEITSQDYIAKQEKFEFDPISPFICDTKFSVMSDEPACIWSFFGVYLRKGTGNPVRIRISTDPQLFLCNSDFTFFIRMFVNPKSISSSGSSKYFSLHTNYFGDNQVEVGVQIDHTKNSGFKIYTFTNLTETSSPLIEFFGLSEFPLITEYCWIQMHVKYTNGISSIGGPIKAVEKLFCGSNQIYSVTGSTIIRSPPPGSMGSANVPDVFVYNTRKFDSTVQYIG